MVMMSLLPGIDMDYNPVLYAELEDMDSGDSLGVNVESDSDEELSQSQIDLKPNKVGPLP
jgi:hypothetical protein